MVSDIFIQVNSIIDQHTFNKRKKIEMTFNRYKLHKIYYINQDRYMLAQRLNCYRNCSAWLGEYELLRNPFHESFEWYIVALHLASIQPSLSSDNALD